MNISTLVVVVLGTVIVPHSPGAGLMVDFGASAFPVAAGYQSYATTNAAPDPSAVVYTPASTVLSTDVTLDVDALLDQPISSGL